ncbi:uncharacterized protein LOC9633333 [Selaginella moellendorffii]|nr:uncharacterized protein LOC9633333 [Selaginella moellendorffii]|eukprot:XP_002968012.2 uncharacterized protein LOC9633333 [Selaginella moellendorffii]
MGCASSRVMHLQAEREDNPGVSATPKRSRKRSRAADEDLVDDRQQQRQRSHFVALTSSTYGVLDRDGKLEKKDRPEVINAVELMKGLEGDDNRQEQEQQDFYALSQTSHHPRGSSSNSSTSTYDIVRELHRSDQELEEQPRQQCQHHHQRSSKKMRCLSSKASNSIVETATSSSSTSTSRSLFDPDLLESIERAFEQISEEDWNSKKSPSDDSQRDLSAARPLDCDPKDDPRSLDENPAELRDFQLLCPPAGESKAVVYYTSLRGVRRTHEECSTVLEIVRSYGVSVGERDLSMHQAFRQELKELSQSCAVPRLFVRGRLIGGLEEVSRAHEKGLLARLLQGIRREDHSKACDGCGGARFMLCLDCNGSCKILAEDGSGEKIQCLECNENGLIRCPICC